MVNFEVVSVTIVVFKVRAVAVLLAIKEEDPWPVPSVIRTREFFQKLVVQETPLEFMVEEFVKEVTTPRMVNTEVESVVMEVPRVRTVAVLLLIREEFPAPVPEVTVTRAPVQKLVVHEALESVRVVVPEEVTVP
jgi:hypothetical protein